MEISLNRLVYLFRKHEAWCKRSGFASLSWLEFVASRKANGFIIKTTTD